MTNKSLNDLRKDIKQHMNIIEQVFHKKRVITSSLEKYGFINEAGMYRLSRFFIHNDFRADITVSSKGVITATVIDTATDEEYLPLLTETCTGTFVGDVRREFTAILENIADNCFIEEPFSDEQTNRIAGMILEKFGEEPDYPFKKLPDCGVFRYPGNRKWYAVVLNVKRNLLKNGKVHQSPADNHLNDAGTVDIINLKASEERIEELLRIPGIYPAYHMNKKSWLSIVLDGKQPDSFILSLIEESRRSVSETGGVKKNRKEAAALSWIVPANPRYYDIATAFQNERDIIWKQTSGVRTGDTVFIYVTAPVSAVIYRCLVMENDIPYSYHGRHMSISKVMKIRLQETYPQDLYPLQRLKTLGVTAVRSARTASASFTAEVEKNSKKAVKHKKKIMNHN